MRRVLAVVLVVVGSVALSASPALGIIGGEPDGDRHTNVGLIVALDDRGHGLGSCTGTLVAPTVVVTAAHCADPQIWAPDVVARYVVSFVPSLRHDPARDVYVLDRYITATAHLHPGYSSFTTAGVGTRRFLEAADVDLAVLVLQEPAATVFPGVAPAPVVAAGALDEFATGTRNRYFTQVGYGVQREFEPPVAGGIFFDATRNVATSALSKLTALRLVLQGNARDSRGTGGTCSGDSGGPVLLGPTIVAVHSYGQQSVHGVCGTLGGNVRLDTTSARAFLSRFIPL